MRGIVFSGPSLPRAAVEAAGVEWRPPLAQGDLYRAALERPSVIGVVDGYFEVVPTVWHKEILWAMAQGIRVYGAASIGAIRAAELADFGMIGVGKIYEEFRSGVLQDDDEVALLHGPEEVGFIALTEPMVNVRATVERARAAGNVNAEAAGRIVAAAKGLYYKERTLDRTVARAVLQGLALESTDRCLTVLETAKFDLKRQDAIGMLRRVQGDVAIWEASMNATGGRCR
jgi:hypothetical protein